MFAWKPRPVAVSANAPCTSSQARTQRPHEMQSSCWKTRYGWRVVVLRPGGARPSSAARRRRGARRPRRARCARPGGSGSSERTSSTTFAAIRCTRSSVGDDRACPRGTGVVHEATGARALDRRRGRRGRRRTAPCRSSKQSVGTPACRRACAASSTVAPGSTSTATPSTKTSIRRAPARRGSARCRLRIGAGMPPPCAQRLADLERLEQLLELARGRPARRPSTISSAAAAGRSGRGSTCRSSRARRSGAGASRARACRCGRRRRRCRRGRPCSPRPPARRSRTACRASRPGRIPPSGPPIWSALIARPSRRPPPSSSQISRIGVPKRTS